MTSDWLPIFQDYKGVRQITTLIFCVGTVITSCEYLVIRKEFGDRGRYSWKILSSRPEYLNSYLFRRLRLLFGYSGCVAIHISNIACCILLPLQSNQTIKALLISAVATGFLIMSFRNIVGNDGADQMSRVICLALCVAYWSEDPFVSKAALVFIASQAIMSYTVAGIAKLSSKKWRSGLAVFEITNTETYGDGVVAAFLADAPRALNQVLCWNVILVESLFWIVIIVPAPLCAWFLIGVCGFHLYNAAVMGLNNFVWAFCATFPSIIFLNQLVTHRIWG